MKTVFLVVELDEAFVYRYQVGNEKAKKVHKLPQIPIFPSFGKASIQTNKQNPNFLIIIQISWLRNFPFLEQGFILLAFIGLSRAI